MAELQGRRRSIAKIGDSDCTHLSRRLRLPFAFLVVGVFFVEPRAARFWGVPGAAEEAVPLVFEMPMLDFTSLRILTRCSVMARGVGLSISAAANY